MPQSYHKAKNHIPQSKLLHNTTIDEVPRGKTTSILLGYGEFLQRNRGQRDTCFTNQRPIAQTAADTVLRLWRE